jgi:hypothetical protein
VLRGQFTVAEVSQSISCTSSGHLMSLVFQT